MCALQSRGMSVVCTWGLRGIFFLHLYFLWSSPTALCAVVWVLFPTRTILYNICTPFSYTRYVKFSNTPNFMSSTSCVLLTICPLTTWRPTSNFKPPSNTSLHRHHWIHLLHRAAARLTPLRCCYTDSIALPSNSLPCSNSHHHHV